MDEHRYKHGDPHPTKPGWRFFAYVKRSDGVTLREKWSGPEAWAKKQAGNPEAKRRYYLKHKDRILASTKARYERLKATSYFRDAYATKADEQPGYHLWYSKRNQCKHKGIPFALPKSFYADVPTVCPVLGIPMGRHAAKTLGADHRATVDRTVPALGYVPGNAVWMSARANRLKSNATLEELKQVVAFLQSHLLLRNTNTLCLKNYPSDSTTPSSVAA